MKKTTGSYGDAPRRENVHELRLVALLLDLVERHGRADTAEILGVSYDTVARAASSGRLTGRVSDALARHLLEGSEPQVIAEQRDRMADLERRVEALEQTGNAMTDSVSAALDAMRAEMRGLRDAPPPEPEPPDAPALTRAWIVPEPEAAPKAHQTSPAEREPWLFGLAPAEPVPDEEKIYGEAAGALREWREAWSAYRRLPDGVAKLETELRILELEIALIDAHRLTLPPAKYPWDRFERRDEIRRRRRSVGEAQADLRRAIRRRRLRRVCTLGLRKD